MSSNMNAYRSQRTRGGGGGGGKSSTATWRINRGIGIAAKSAKLASAICAIVRRGAGGTYCVNSIVSGDNSPMKSMLIQFYFQNKIERNLGNDYLYRSSTSDT